MGTVSVPDEDEEEALCLRLTSILHDILLSVCSLDKKEEIRK